MVCMPNGMYAYGMYAYGMYHSIKLPFDAEVAEKLYNDSIMTLVVSCISAEAELAFSQLNIIQKGFFYVFLMTSRDFFCQI